MRAILVPVGEMPRIVEINGLKSMQKAVGGLIEPCSWVFNDHPSVYVNEEGKSTCEPNRAVYARPQDEGKYTWHGKLIEKNTLLDIIFGDFLCVGFDEETGEDRDITDDEIDIVMRRFGTERSIMSGPFEALKILAFKAG